MLHYYRYGSTKLKFLQNRTQIQHLEKAVGVGALGVINEETHLADS